MKFQEAMDFIEECNKAGIVPGLDSVTELCRRVGNPQDELRFIHIAGTNGKGSTLAYMSTILTTAGYRVGRYISPTIRDYLERFQVDGKVITKTLFSELVDTVKQACDQMVADGLPHPTAFEVETAIAFLFFINKKCDLVVLECGMGGREDATNLINNTVMEVFAHIDMDHMQFLGDTLSKIAWQKAGIIKKGSFAVTGIQQEEALKVLKNECLEKEVELTVLDESMLSSIKYSLSGQTFTYEKEKYRTPLLGVCQVDNAALAVCAMKELDKKIENGDIEWLNKRITYRHICDGLMNTVWPARLQVVSKKPLMVIDGAHNIDAVKRLRESVDTYFSSKRKIYIVGMFRDKAVDEMIEIMCKDADMIMTVAAPNNPRALSSVELAHMIAPVNPNVTSLDSVEEACEMSRLCADNNTLILAWGSLAYLGRILDCME